MPPTSKIVYHMHHAAKKFLDVHAVLCHNISMIQACYQALQGRACWQTCIWDLEYHAAGSERLKALKAIINIAVLCQVRSAFVNVPSYTP